MKERIQGWGFERKLKLFISASIIMVSFLVLLVSTVSAIRNVYKNTITTAQKQLEFLGQNYESVLEQYKSSCVSILMDSSVQHYLKGSAGDEVKDLAYQEAARGILKQIYNTNSLINFVAVISYPRDSYLYRGNSMMLTEFRESYEKDFAMSIPGNQSAVRLSFGNHYYGEEPYVLTMYFPGYSTQNLGQINGLICINFRDTLLSGLSGQSDIDFSQLLLTDMDGVLLSGADKQRIGIQTEYNEKLQEDNGNFQHGNKLIIYQKVGKWNYYLVNELPLSDLYLPGIRTAVLVAVLIGVFIVICVAAAGKIFSRVYAPLDQLVQDMSRVSQGSMDIRINAEHVGRDFEQMGEGFNQMMDRLSEAMEEIRIKQEQLAQTRLNALQSQIQPHFLYNTLECIHWQAVAEGNQEVSKLVKALASYYRICLSKGRDVIPLSEELSHIRYYVIIQNMRFDDTIRLEVQVPEKYYGIMLPKLTLQPLVENAIEHGISLQEGRKGVIKIWVEEDGEEILLKVLDSGNRVTEEMVEKMNQYLHMDQEDFGYGVRNVNRRIELLFGREYGLYYQENEYHGITVTVRLPGNGGEEADAQGVDRG